jgi:hypothetical protein
VYCLIIGWLIVTTKGVHGHDERIRCLAFALVWELEDGRIYSISGWFQHKPESALRREKIRAKPSLQRSGWQ